ncbi:EscU/YscU/HrcU family type III secretion system export apparatus switch protein [Trinickia sp. LjRoot230]|uniref:EscU/YscU/HrcU family type III secretion system export apparatus switch protein n=1 Tax=Trinickia sp. LjRoot230 TaxID=3342288 RepID=UPI003ECCE225
MTEKALPPTAKRLRDARARGEVPRSEQLVALVVMAACVELVFWGGGTVCGVWLDILEHAVTAIESKPLLVAAISVAQASLSLALGVLACVSATAVAAAIFGSWISGTLCFAPKALAPSLKRLDPFAQLKQRVSAQNLLVTAIAILTACVIGVAGVGIFVQRLPVVVELLRLQSLELTWQACIDTLHFALRALLAALIAPAVLSVVIAKRQYRQKLRMSHREAKDETKQSTGDPFVRARQRAALLEAALTPLAPATAAQQRPATRVLVTNPEHFAVLLYYDGEANQAPIILAKGADELAWQMSDDAQLGDVPVFRFRKLARRLFAEGQPHAPIPPDCYRAVAIVYRLVEEMQALGARHSAPINIDDTFFD